MEKQVLRESKAPCASSLQPKDILDEVRAESGEAMELNPLMNRR